jgi:hypothetical protein
LYALIKSFTVANGIKLTFCDIYSLTVSLPEEKILDDTFLPKLSLISVKSITKKVYNKKRQTTMPFTKNVRLTLIILDFKKITAKDNFTFSGD